MKNLKIFLLLILGLLANIPVVAQDDIVNDYMVDFNSPITTNTSPHGAENRDFIVSSGWGHLVGMQEIGAGNVPTYVPYTYNATGGVDDSGCLQAGAGSVYDSWNEDYVNIWDYLVTPLVKGTVTISMKKANANGFIEFCTMQKNGDKWEVGVLLNATAIVLPNTENFVTYTLPELTKYTYIGIRMVHCYVDNFKATTANFKKMSSLKINDISPNTDTTVDADAEGKFDVTFTTTVTNNGDFDIAAGTENYSVSLYKYNAGGSADKADHVHLVTVPITEDLARKATSGELTLTATLNTADYETAMTNGISFRIYENISGTYKSTKSVKVVPYVPILSLQTKIGNSTKTYVDGEELYLGTSLSALSQDMEIVNSGGAPLEITGVTVPEGFTTTLAAQNIAPHNRIAFNIATTESAGVKEGDLVIKSNAGDFTLKMSAVIAAADKYFVNFETDDSAVGMIAEKIADGFYSYGWITNNTNEAGYPGNEKNAFLKTDVSEKAQGPFKLITPLLKVADGETLSFEAARYYVQQAELKVYYSADRSTWNLVRTLSTAEGTAPEDMFSDENAPKYGKKFLRYTINNIPAGEWYLAFEGGNNKPVFIDNILGYKRVDVAHDVKINATIPESGMVNGKMTITVNALNLLGKSESGSGYVAKVLFGDKVVKEMPGITIPAGGNVNFNIDVTPHVVGTFDAVVKFVFADGNEAKSETKSVTIAEETFSSVLEAGGPATGKSYLAPFGTYYKKSESQSIYLPADLKGLTPGSKITSITYRGHNTKVGDSEYDTQVWIGETTLNEFATLEPIDKSTLKKVFDGKIKPNQTQTSEDNDDLMVFTFAEPYVYQGGNIVVGVRTEAESYNMSFGIGYSVCETTKSIRRGVDNGDLDSKAWTVSSSGAYTTTPKTLPVVYFGVLAEAPVVSGVVTDKAGGQKINGAQVTATSGDVIYETTTNDEGKYSISILQPVLEYELRVHAEGYAPKKENINVSAGSIENKNIELQEAKGLFIESSEIARNGMVNFKYNAKAKATNYTMNDFAAGSYTAKLYVNNEAVAEAEAVEMKKGASADFKFSFTPHAEGTFPAYIEFVQGENTTATETQNIVISAESVGGIIQVCDSTAKTTDAPINLYYNNSVSDVYYTPEMLTAFGVPVGGTITKIMYKMWASSPKKNIDFTLNAWVGTADGDPANIKAITAEEKTAAKESLTHAVVDKTYDNFTPDGISATEPAMTEIEIDLSENPIVFDGLHSVRVIMEKSSSSWVGGCNFAYDSKYKTAYVNRNDNVAPEGLGTTTSVSTPVAYFTIKVGANVKGTVTDAVTSEPLAGASVKLKSGDVLYSATTGNDGKYDIRVNQLQIEDYVMEVEATDEYEVRTVSVGKILEGMVKDAALRKAATVSGKITSARDESIVSGATVTLTDTAEKVVATATTAEDGMYSFKVRLLDADYKITVEADKFVKAEAEITALVANVEKNFALETIAKRIYGVVRDMNTMQPLAGAEVFYSRGKEDQMIVHTDADGKYELLMEDTSLPFTLGARLKGYLSDFVVMQPFFEDMEYNFELEQLADGIDAVDTDEIAGSKIYDLNGRLVNINGDTRNLKRGQVYIVNGKKVVLK